MRQLIFVNHQKLLNPLAKSPLMIGKEMRVLDSETQKHLRHGSFFNRENQALDLQTLSDRLIFHRESRKDTQISVREAKNSWETLYLDMAKNCDELCKTCHFRTEPNPVLISWSISSYFLDIFVRHGGSPICHVSSFFVFIAGQFRGYTFLGRTHFASWWEIHIWHTIHCHHPPFGIRATNIN